MNDDLTADQNVELCASCGKPIAADELFASGPRGKMHYRCFKVGKMHGREVTLPRCPNCNEPIFQGDTCSQCGVGPQIGGAS